VPPVTDKAQEVGLPVNASKAAKFTAFLDWALPAAVPGGRIWVKVPPA
jgi:hypothetical protein